MISTDRNIFERGSAVSERMSDYGTILDELHIIIFSRSRANMAKGEKIQIAERVYAYPTNSVSRLLYVTDALKIGRRILSASLRGGRASLSELREAYENPDKATASWLITCQDPFETGLVGMKLRKQFDVRLQIQIHTDFLSPGFAAQGVLNKLRLFEAKYILPKADCLRVVSENLARSLSEDKRFGLKTHPSVLPIYVDSKKIQEPVAQERIEAIRARYSRYDFIALCSGRLAGEKNFILAIKAFRSALREHPRALLLIVGSGPEEGSLVNLAYKLGIADSVAFEPWQDDMRPYYAAANLYVLTSDYEGYSMSLVEAAASGCPLVSTDVGLASSIIADGKSGFLCPVGDQECVSRGIARVMGDVPLRLAMKNASRESAVRHLLSKEDYLKKLKELWQKC
jgi:glycosyltransferase involved in cell wall biosynthesis